MNLDLLILNDEDRTLLLSQMGWDRVDTGDRMVWVNWTRRTISDQLPDIELADALAWARSLHYLVTIAGDMDGNVLVTATWPASLPGGAVAQVPPLVWQCPTAREAVVRTMYSIAARTDPEAF